MRLGIDLGGTKTAISVVDDGHRVVAEGIVPTLGPGGLEGWLLRVKEAADGLLAGTRPQAVGVGVAGPVSEDGRLLTAPNLGWPPGSPLREGLERTFGCPAAVENDANALLLGELVAGAARGRHSVFLVAVGTGIGGAVLQGGRLVRGERGLAGEIGHMPVHGSRRRCGCGAVGHLEAVSAGRGLAAAAQEDLAGAGPSQGEELRRRLAAGEGTRGVIAAAEAGDPIARAVVEEGARCLGEAMAGVVSVLDPEQVILTGGMARAGYAYAERVMAAFRASAFGPLAEVPWAISELAEKAGTIGSAWAASRATQGPGGA